MAFPALSDIQNMVRQLTATISTQQLSDADLNTYINTFIQYRFPASIRLFSLRTTFTFYTQPFVDTYSTQTTNVNDPLYNFDNTYLAVHPPVFLSGVQGFYTQWREVFYGYYPQTNTIANTNVFGDGTPGPFAGTVVAHPMIQNNVIFTCLDTTGAAMILVDTPTSNTTGQLNQFGSNVSVGTINYVTGAFSGLTFPNNTQPNAPIICENIAYQPGKPLSVLYYNNTFTIRPVPDNVYPIQLEADIIPTALLSSGQSPQLNAWWEYIAYGAALVRCERMRDWDSYEKLFPLFRKQESYVLRTTLTQYENERTVTIYTQGKNYNWGWFAGGWPY